MKKLKIFCAGVAGQLAKAVVEEFEKKYPDISCDLSVGGSNAGISRLIGGENFDVMILADSSNIDQMMMPGYSEGYFIWGGNEMVVMGSDIRPDNWIEKLLDPQAQIKHASPFDDPGGYRAVMAMTLADQIKPGLSEQLLKHPNYKGLEPDQYQQGFKPVKEQVAGIYRILYKSIPVSLGLNFAPLPPQMNLGDPAYEALYHTAEFVIASGETVKGTTILHAVTIPKTAQNKKDAESFVGVFLESDFMEFGFTGVQKEVGVWEI